MSSPTINQKAGIFKAKIEIINPVTNYPGDFTIQIIAKSRLGVLISKLKQKAGQTIIYDCYFTLATDKDLAVVRDLDLEVNRNSSKMWVNKQEASYKKELLSAMEYNLKEN